MNWELLKLALPVSGGIADAIGAFMTFRAARWKIRLEAANDLISKTEKRCSLLEKEYADLERRNLKTMADLREEYDRLVKENAELRRKLFWKEWTPGADNPFHTTWVKF